MEGAIESGGRGRKSIEHTAIGAGAGALLGGIFGGGRSWYRLRDRRCRRLGNHGFPRNQKITLISGQEMLIRIIARQ